MAQRTPRRALPILARLLDGLLAIGIGCCASAAVAAPDRTWAAPPLRAPREVNLTRIVSVLENRLPSHELSEKAKAKLLALSDRQVRIAASLAERITQADPAAVAETAFLLLTLLIILS